MTYILQCPIRHHDDARKELAHLFLQACYEHVQSPALITDAAVFDYKWLHASALTVESQLSSAQVQPSQVVALCVPPGPILVAAIMGCILRGAVFLMVDPTLPMLRKKSVMEASKPCVVISWMQSEGLELMSVYPPALMFTMFLDAENSLRIHPETKGNVTEVFTCSKNTLYIMFTSGSTGSPKGVCASAAGTLNRFSWMWDTFPFKNSDVVCFKTSVLFVDSIWEIFGSILKGMPLAIPTPDVARDPRLLLSFARKHQVTHLTVTPTLLRHVLELAGAAESLNALVFCFASGEPLSVALCTRFFNILPSSRLINLYGTTEICADITFFEVTSEYLSKSTSPLVPIGKPISNVCIEVVDTVTGATVHEENYSEQGELVVYGSCVADVYLDQAIQKKIHKEQCKSFNTHDVVQYAPYGNLMYIGRSDHQIKLGGIKINPCEVEAILEQYSGVTKAAVVARESKLSLIGFVQMPRCHPAFEAANQGAVKFSYSSIDYVSSQSMNRSLSAHLAQYLPKHCIPSQFLCSHQLPCLPSGKINRLQLPSASDIAALSPSPDTCTTLVLSRTEEILTELFTQSLGLGVTPDPSDNFVSMGGNSLLAIDLSVQLEKCFGCSVLIHDLLSGLSIKSLASMIDKLIAAAKTPNTPCPSPKQQSEVIDQPLDSGPKDPGKKESRLYGVLGDPDEHPLLLTQHMVWLAQQTIRKEGIVIEIAALCLETVDVGCLHQALLHLFLHHESLRTLIRENKRGVPFRHIVPLSSPDILKLQESVFSIKSCFPISESQHNEVPIFDGTQVWLPKFNFSLENGPLWQTTFFKDVRNGSTCKDELVNILAFQFHHIIIDGWSLKEVMTDLDSVYKHLTAGGSIDSLPVLHNKLNVIGMTDIANAEHANLQDQATVSKKLNYWVNQLKHCTAPMLLPAERTFSLAYNETGTSSIYRNLQFQRNDFQTTLKAYGVSEFVLTYASFLFAMYAVTGSQDVTIYLPVANRTPINAHIVGMVVETMPLRVVMSPNMSLNALLHSVKTAALELFQNMHPYVLVDQWVRNNGAIYVSHPISGHYLQTMFVFDYDRTILFSNSSMLREIPVCEHFTACAITIYVHMDQSQDQLGVHVIYDTDWFDASTINVFLGAWEAAIPITLAINHYDKPINSLSKQIYASISQEDLCPDQWDLKAIGEKAALFGGTGLAISLVSSPSIHICPSHMEHILCGLKHTAVSHSITEIIVLHPTSALLCAFVAATVYLRLDVCILPSKEALGNYLTENPHKGSVLVLLTHHCDVSNINSFAVSKQLSNVHVVSAESLLFPGVDVQSSPMVNSVTTRDQGTILLSEDDFKVNHSAHTATCSCSCHFMQLLSLTSPKECNSSATKVHCIRQQDVLTILECFHGFHYPSRAAIFMTPLCPTFSIAIALLLEGIPLQVYSDTDISKVSSLANLDGIQEADLLIVPEILVSRILRDLPLTWPRKQIWIHGLPLCMAHVTKNAEKHFTQVVVTHSLLPDDILITHHLKLDTSAAPPPGTSWMPLGHAVCGLNWKVEHPDGRQVIPGFAGCFTVSTANKVVLRSKAIVKQAISGCNAGSFQLLSLESDAYYHGNDLTPLIILLGQLPNIMWCYRSVEGVLFADCVNNKAAVVDQVLKHLQPSFVKYLYLTDYPPMMTSHFLVDEAQSSSSCCTAQVPDVADDGYQVVLVKMIDIVSRVFCIEPDEIEKNHYVSSIGGYCMENYFQLTLELNSVFKTSLTFKEVSETSTMADLVTLMLSNM